MSLPKITLDKQLKFKIFIEENKYNSYASIAELWNKQEEENGEGGYKLTQADVRNFIVKHNIVRHVDGRSFRKATISDTIKKGGDLRSKATTVGVCLEKNELDWLKSLDKDNKGMSYIIRQVIKKYKNEKTKNTLCDN